VFVPLLLHARNPGPMTGGGNNTYVLAPPDGEAVLIDAGVGKRQHLADLAAVLDAAHARLSHVVVTHAHADHASGAPVLAAAYPEARFSKYPWPDKDSRYAVDWQPLHDGDAIPIGPVSSMNPMSHDQLIVLHTPGHSPDHVSLWHEPTRSVFTGDLVVAGSSVMIDWSRGGSLGEYMRSLERIRSLEPHVLFPAHGPRIDAPREILTGYLEHRRARERQVIDALRAGQATVEAIAESIYHGLDSALMAAARENVRAHLDKLKADGLATEDDGRWHLTERAR